MPAVMVQQVAHMATMIPESGVAPASNVLTTGGTTITDTSSLVEIRFTASGTLALINPGMLPIDYLVVGGGGAGGSNMAGGGGGGQVQSGASTLIASQSVTIGAGGTGTANANGTAGGSSILGSIATSTGGGYGGRGSGPGSNGGTGVNGGGGGGDNGGSPGTGGVGTAFSGGNGGPGAGIGFGGGGAGASAVGQNGSSPNAGNGGNGVTWNGNTYGGGGGGAPNGTTGGGGNAGAGGTGGGGAGSVGGASSGPIATAGTANTGGGGGATGNNNIAGAAGGSGIVIVRYDPRNFIGGGAVTQVGDYTYHTFNSAGTLALGSNVVNLPIDYAVVGGGGAGSPGTNGVRYGGGGAGGTIRSGSSIISASQSTTIGAGGVGTNTNATPGGNGGSSSLGVIATATGGNGGPANSGTGATNADFSGGSVGAIDGPGGAGSGVNGSTVNGGNGTVWNGTTYGGGGGGITNAGPVAGTGGTGGGTNGGTAGSSTAAAANTGGGSGGCGSGGAGTGNGGSGVVIVRYRTSAAYMARAGLYQWFDASDTTTITGGGTVTQVNDISGNAKHLTPGAAASPASGTRTQNSKNVIDFNGTTQGLGNTAVSLPLTNFTVVWVGAQDNSAVVAGFINFYLNSGSHDYDNGNSFTFNSGATGPNRTIQSYSNNVEVTLLGSAPPTPGAVWALRKNGTAITIWKNGVQVASGTWSSTTGTSDRMSTGWRAKEAANFLDGFWGEEAVYTTALPDADLAYQYTYLGPKWGY